MDSAEYAVPITALAKPVNSTIAITTTSDEDEEIDSLSVSRYWLPVVPSTSSSTTSSNATSSNSTQTLVLTSTAQQSSLVVVSAAIDDEYWLPLGGALSTGTATSSATMPPIEAPESSLVNHNELEIASLANDDVPSSSDDDDDDDDEMDPLLVSRYWLPIPSTSSPP